MKYDKFDKCEYSRKFEGCSTQVKEMLNALASSLYRTNVAHWEIHELGAGLWDVEIKFFNSKGARNFQRQYEIQMNASAERLKEHKMKDKEVRTTVLKVQDAYKNAECDETRETLKTVFPDAFEDEYKWEDVTEQLQWSVARINPSDVQSKFNLIAHLPGYDSKGCVLTFTGKKVFLWNVDKIYKLIQHDPGGFTLLRKEKV